MWSFLVSKTRRGAAYRSSCSIVALSGMALLFLLHQSAAAQDDNAIMEAIRAIEAQSTREGCWRVPSGWHGGDSSTLPPASNILTDHDFSASISLGITQRSYHCASDFEGGRFVAVGRSCIYLSDPSDEDIEGKDGALVPIRSTVIYEDGSSIESIDGMLVTEDDYHSYEVVIPDVSDAYLEEGFNVPLTIFTCSATSELDRDMFMTACQAVIELTTLASQFKPGLGLCEIIEEIPELNP